MVKISNLHKSFDSIKAVNGLSFEIKKGEIVGFLGPNGAGKSTTMRMMAGFLSPDNGEIEIAGIPVNEQTAIAAQKHIGYLPENNPLYGEMLVSEILRLSADLKQIPREKQRAAFDFAVKSTGIGEVFYRPIRELSKGYKQRVGLAIALLHQPDILILDEPTEGLDPNQRTEIRSLIKELAKEHTIIMSTHVMQEVTAVCSRILIINNGRLVADGTEEELARAAKKERVLHLEIEGAGIDLALRNLAGLEHIDIDNNDAGKISATLVSNESVELRPEISRLAHANNWTIWRLVEREQKLEEVFHKLTQ
ncbi:MAG TPA: ATP-binding cassette domain-containing protein [Candidatus Paceibacterota bacterium]